MTKKRIPKKRVDKVIKRNINEPRSINTLGKVIPELPSYRLLHILATGIYMYIYMYIYIYCTY